MDFDFFKQMPVEQAVEIIRIIPSTLTFGRGAAGHALYEITEIPEDAAGTIQVEFNGSNTLTIQGVAASDQDILKFIDNLGKQELVEQASLSSMRLPRTTQSGTTMKGFRVFVKIKRV